MSTAIIPHDQRAAIIEERKAQNRMMQQIRGTVWSKDLDHNTTLAVAEYCRRNDIDAATEVEILGGRIYKNANWYERKGAELMAMGVVRSIDADHIADDPRLARSHAQALEWAAEALAADDPQEAEHWRQEARAIRREQMRRARARVEHNAPEKAAAVVVTTIALTNGVTVTGCNWCGGGVRQRDPVGDAEPTKTAETRSARRAWKKLAGAAQAGHVQHPAITAMAHAARTDDDDSIALEEMIQASHAALAAHNGANRVGGAPIAALGAGDDEYGQQDLRPVAEPLTADTVPARTSAARGSVPTSPGVSGSVFLPDGGPPAGITPAEYDEAELAAVPSAAPALVLGDVTRGRRSPQSEGR